MELNQNYGLKSIKNKKNLKKSRNQICLMLEHINIIRLITKLLEKP